VSYYALLLVVYLGIDTIAAWGLNLEYGVAGVANLGYILLIAAGAYTYAVLRLPHAVNLGTAASYIGGEHWPGWTAVLGAIVVGGVLGGALGVVAVRRIRLDYFALVMFGFEILAWTIVGAYPNFLGGQNGLFFIPDPGVSNSSWSYAALIVIVCAGTWLILRRFTAGPVGRTLRAIRDAPASASGLGKNLFAWRTSVQVVGGAMAALSGALLGVIENLCVAAQQQRAESVIGLLNGRRWWRAQEAEFVARAELLLERFNLAAKANDRAGTLSGGERKMLDVMRAFMAAPRILLLDEPMAGVTPALCERIESALTELADSGTAVVVVEHDLASVGRICDHVVVMALGRVIETGTMNELRSSAVVQQAYLNG